MSAETDPPRLKIERDVVAAVIHYSAALTVYATAEPRPRFTWYNGTTPLTTHSQPRRVHITADSEVDSPNERWKTVFRYSSTLTLSNVDVWDLTEYRVVVENDYGSNQTSLRLIEASE